MATDRADLNHGTLYAYCQGCLPGLPQMQHGTLSSAAKPGHPVATLTGDVNASNPPTRSPN